MKVLDPGHSYQLDNIRNHEVEAFNKLYFYKDPDINDVGQRGTNCQEVLRVLIDRVEYLDRQEPHPMNVTILQDLRSALAGFESRHLYQLAKKGRRLEHVPIDSLTGHMVNVDA